MLKVKIELSIRDDKELRDMIKDLIRGQVVSTVRATIHTVMQEEMKKSFPSAGFIESTLQSQTAGLVSKAIDKYDPAKKIREMVQTMIREAVIEEVRKTLKG